MLKFQRIMTLCWKYFYRNGSWVWFWMPPLFSIILMLKEVSAHSEKGEETKLALDELQRYRQTYVRAQWGSKINLYYLCHPAVEASLPKKVNRTKEPCAFSCFICFQSLTFGTERSAPFLQLHNFWKSCRWSFEWPGLEPETSNQLKTWPLGRL